MVSGFILVVKDKHKTGKVKRRVVKSMKPLRIYLGSNFVITPFVIQLRFCISQTMNYFYWRTTYECARIFCFICFLS